MDANEVSINKDLFIRELEFIQTAIKRMADNSFMIKGWTISLVLIAMLLNTVILNKLLALFPCIVFWYLDSYYLHLEKCYRALYDWVVINRPHNQDYFFNLDAKQRFSNKVDSVTNVMFSSSIAPFYIVTIVLIVLITILLLVNG